MRNTRDPRSPELYVGFTPTADGPATLRRLTSQLGFTVQWVPTGTPGFLALLSDEQIAVIRCDPSVAFVEWNVLGMVGALSRAP